MNASPQGHRPPPSVTEDSPTEALSTPPRNGGTSEVVDARGVAAELVALRKEHEARYSALAAAALSQAEGQREIAKEVGALRGEVASTRRAAEHASSVGAATSRKIDALTLEVRGALVTIAKDSGQHRAKLDSVSSEIQPLKKAIEWRPVLSKTAIGIALVVASVVGNIVKDLVLPHKSPPAQVGTK